MAPNLGYIMQNNMTEPVSRTYQYRKVMKPMLERKRRARINRCLDELKELMTGALQTEGENVAKLEKADILELTVRHLHNLRRQNQLATRPEHSYADRFRAGFRHCAVEVTTFLNGLDAPTKSHLSSHLSGCIRRLETYPGQQQQQPAQVVPAAEDVVSHRASVPFPVPAVPPSTAAVVSRSRSVPALPAGFYAAHPPNSDYHQALPLVKRESHRGGGDARGEAADEERDVSSPNSAMSGDENVWRPW